MSSHTLLDGVPVREALADDRGLHYGDGLFETMVWCDGALRFFDRHVARLERGCRILGIEPPRVELLEADLATLALGDGPCVVKLIITRGSGGSGYVPAAPTAPRRLWQTRNAPAPDPAIYRDGVTVAWLDFKLARQGALAGIKHLGRLEQVMAARELAQRGAFEGLVCDNAGSVIEAVSANVFAVRDGQLHTPELAQCGVAGVMREVVLDTATEIGVAWAERVLRRADLAYADEVFLTNSVRGIVPVRRMGEIRFAGHQVARRLSESLAEHGIMQCG